MRRSLVKRIFSPEKVIPAMVVLSLANIGTCVHTQKRTESLHPIIDTEKLEEDKRKGIKSRSERRIEEADSFLEKASIKGIEYGSYFFHYALLPGRQMGYSQKIDHTPKNIDPRYQNQRNYENTRPVQRRRPRNPRF